MSPTFLDVARWHRGHFWDMVNSRVFNKSDKVLFSSAGKKYPFLIARSNESLSLGLYLSAMNFNCHNEILGKKYFVLHDNPSSSVSSSLSAHRFSAAL